MAPNDRVPLCNGCPTNTTLPFDHCKLSPDVVDVGSLVDYPRRHCGQNPIFIRQCFDDVDFIKRSRAYLFRGTGVSFPSRERRDQRKEERSRLLSAFGPKRGRLSFAPRSAS